MSDERLRTLERAARASPEDRGAGWAFAQALERAGEGRRGFLELARLARTGDVLAASAVDERLSRPRTCGDARAWRSRARGLRSEGRVSENRLALRPGPIVAAAATERSVVVTGASLAAIDPRELDLRFVAESDGSAVALRGEDLLHGEGHDLVARDLATGSAISRAPLPGPLDQLDVEGDRALCLLEPGAGAARDHPLVALDVGDAFGRVLWSRPAPPFFTAARGRAFFLHFDEAVEAVSLESGASLWRSEPPYAAHWPACTLAVDHELAILDHYEGLVAFDAATGARRWSGRHFPFVHKLALADAGLVLVNLTPRGLGLHAADVQLAVLDRSTGEPRWAVQLEAGTTTQEVALAVSTETIYLALGRAGSSVIDLAAHDLGSGARLFELPLDVYEPPRSLSLVPLAGSVVVLAGTSGGAIAIRLDERAA